MNKTIENNEYLRQLKSEGFRYVIFARKAHRGAHGMVQAGQIIGRFTEDGNPQTHIGTCGNCEVFDLALIPSEGD